LDEHAALLGGFVWVLYPLYNRSPVSEKKASLAIPVEEGKILGCWAGNARPTPPIFPFAAAIPREPKAERMLLSNQYILQLPTHLKWATIRPKYRVLCKWLELNPAISEHFDTGKFIDLFIKQ
jgi:hypothetical protein